jgi:hypothetical protein
VRAFLVASMMLAATATAAAAPALVPQPVSVHYGACTVAAARYVDAIDGLRSAEPGGVALLRNRWTALGIRLAPAPQGIPRSTGFRHSRDEDTDYHLSISKSALNIAAHGRDGIFDALMTLAQLPERRGGAWVLPCVTIDDAPAMRWRIVSDDVSRGPFPTMAYAKERIRTLASLKINGWSPYMEQVVVDPRAPYVAWPNGWTTKQLRELAAYARTYHVTLIPEQQTFAHMHETLKWETFAPLAELPHGYLLAESDPRTYAYLGPLVRSITAAAAPLPFFHLGADEPIDLGRGRTPRTAQTFAAHVNRVAAMLPRGVRPMIWDDAIQQDPKILPLIPRDTVVVAFHYSVEKTYRPYLDPIAAAGFADVVAPGAANWNEIYPDLATAYANVARFVADGRTTHGNLGMFMTVWHDDGESLYEATWPALGYAASAAWQQRPVNNATWHRTFSAAFFGSADPRLTDALDRLRDVRALLRGTPSDPPDYLFWHDPFAPDLAGRFSDATLAAVRTSAEAALAELWDAHPPLHPEAVAVMKLAALRYDELARRLQIGSEAHAYYEDAREAAGAHDTNRVYRSLGVAKYFCWEMRDALTATAPMYAAAWRYESAEPGLRRVLVRYAVAEEDAQRCADRIDAVTREDYLRHGSLPDWDALRVRP